MDNFIEVNGNTFRLKREHSKTPFDTSFYPKREVSGVSSNFTGSEDVVSIKLNNEKILAFIIRQDERPGNMTHMQHVNAVVNALRNYIFN